MFSLILIAFLNKNALLRKFGREKQLRESFWFSMGNNHLCECRGRRQRLWIKCMFTGCSAEAEISPNVFFSCIKFVVLTEWESLLNKRRSESEKKKTLEQSHKKALSTVSLLRSALALPSSRNWRNGKLKIDWSFNDVLSRKFCVPRASALLLRFCSSNVKFPK